MLYHLIKSAERIGFWFVFFFFKESMGLLYNLLGFSLRLGLLYRLFFRIDVGLLFRNDVGLLFFSFFFFLGLFCYHLFIYFQILVHNF